MAVTIHYSDASTDPRSTGTACHLHQFRLHLKSHPVTALRATPLAVRRTAPPATNSPLWLASATEPNFTEFSTQEFCKFFAPTLSPMAGRPPVDCLIKPSWGWGVCQNRPRPAAKKLRRKLSPLSWCLLSWRCTACVSIPPESYRNQLLPASIPPALLMTAETDRRGLLLFVLEWPQSTTKTAKRVALEYTDSGPRLPFAVYRRPFAVNRWES